jgi:hypothetical protein
LPEGWPASGEAERLGQVLTRDVRRSPSNCLRPRCPDGSPASVGWVAISSRDAAWFGRALDRGSRGRWFESRSRDRRYRRSVPRWISLDTSTLAVGGCSPCTGLGSAGEGAPGGRLLMEQPYLPAAGDGNALSPPPDSGHTPSDGEAAIFRGMSRMRNGEPLRLPVLRRVRPAS